MFDPPLSVEQIKWIFFDLDGTLWDHPAALRDGLRMVCELTGMEHAACVEEFIAQSHALWEEVAAGKLDMVTLRTLRFQNVMKALDVQEEHDVQKLTDDYMRHYLSFKGEYPDSPAVLEAAARIAKVGILTNAPHETQDSKLEQLLHRHVIEFMLTTDEANCLKTDPGFYKMAEEWAGNPDPSEILYIGDAWTHDIEPAQKRGWNCVWINLKGTEIPERLPRVWEVRAIGDVLPLLGRKD